MTDASVPHTIGAALPDRSVQPRRSDKELAETLGYSGTQTASVVGITYRQLDYWARTDLIRPSLSDASGSFVTIPPTETTVDLQIQEIDQSTTTAPFATTTTTTVVPGTVDGG